MAGVADEKKRLDDLYQSTYRELKRVARALVRNERTVVLNPTALVNESYVKLSASHKLDEWSAAHFKNVAAQAMRQVLIDEARRYAAEKRGGGAAVHVTLDDQTPLRDMPLDRVLVLNNCLDKLRAMSPRQSEAFAHCHYGGRSHEEIAAMLGVSEVTVGRDLRVAKAWLAGCLRTEPQP